MKKSFFIAGCPLMTCSLYGKKGDQFQIGQTIRLVNPLTRAWAMKMVEWIHEDEDGRKIVVLKL